MNTSRKAMEVSLDEILNTKLVFFILAKVKPTNISINIVRKIIEIILNKIVSKVLADLQV